MHCSIVVLYNPNFYEISNFLNQLIKSEFFLILVDNSEKSLIKEFDVYLKDNRVLYLNLKKNKGLAFAQNIGIKEAITKNFKTLTLFDQDSFITSESYRKYIQTFYKCQYNITSPLLVSKYDNSKREESLKINFFGWPSPVINNEKKTFDDADIVIASGMTCSLKDFQEVGYFREDFFIDYVDIEWCFRAKNKGKTIAVNNLINLSHSIGYGRENYIIFNPQIHPPERTFYQFRNNLALFKESYIPKLYCLRELFVNFASIIIKILFKKNKRKHIYYFYKAIKYFTKFK
jgi:rhamnosyltransferase